MEPTMRPLLWWLFWLSCALLAGCTGEAADTPALEQAGQPVNAAELAARAVVARAAAATGQHEVAQAQLAAMGDDVRRAIKLADPHRPVDRERARDAARSVPGVRSVAWVDAANLFVIVERNAQKTAATIDRVCLALQPLGDTLGVVVNLQSGEARNAVELQLLSRNCQLPPGERAFLQTHKDLNVVPDAVWAQHEANQRRYADDPRDPDAAIRVLEATTPSVQE
jgi:hypothetical protein